MSCTGRLLLKRLEQINTCNGGSRNSLRGGGGQGPRKGRSGGQTKKGVKPPNTKMQWPVIEDAPHVKYFCYYKNYYPKNGLYPNHENGTRNTTFLTKAHEQ